MAQIGNNPQFTTTEAVRGALGVDANDISDQQMIDAELATELSLDLATWLPSWADKLNPGSTPTPEQTILQSAITTYCKWWCAAEYARKVLAFAQLYSDGKAEQRRFTNFDWETLAATCQAKADYYRNMVAELDPELDPSTSADAYVLMSAAVPTNDPVTNEGVRE
jgi:hypothetical protein